MEQASYKNFVSVLSEDKPVMVFFHHKAEASQTQKIKDILKKIKKEMPLLPLYEYVVDENEQNQLLCDYIEVDQTPVLIFFKNGCFHRYKAKGFTEKSILQFIGSKTLYAAKDKNENHESPSL